MVTIRRAIWYHVVPQTHGIHRKNICARYFARTVFSSRRKITNNFWNKQSTYSDAVIHTRGQPPWCLTGSVRYVLFTTLVSLTPYDKNQTLSSEWTIGPMIKKNLKTRKTQMEWICFMPIFQYICRTPLDHRGKILKDAHNMLWTRTQKTAKNTARLNSAKLRNISKCCECSRWREETAIFDLKRQCKREQQKQAEIWRKACIEPLTRRCSCEVERLQFGFCGAESERRCCEKQA